MRGFLHRLLDRDDTLARSLLRHATFRLVPCMNPDGAFRGHLRTNAGGANLNREWVRWCMLLFAFPVIYLFLRSFLLAKTTVPCMLSQHSRPQHPIDSYSVLQETTRLLLWRALPKCSMCWQPSSDWAATCSWTCTEMRNCHSTFFPAQKECLAGSKVHA